MLNYKKLPALVVLLALGGCSLPGYDSAPISATGPWYDFGSSPQATYQQKIQAETQVDYKPSVIKITPALIAYQNAHRSNKLKPSVLKLTRQKPDTNYVIGDGDVLRVIVFNHPELTNPGGQSSGNETVNGQLVNADGDIFFPYVGEVKAAGKTPEQLRKILTQRLSNYIRDPQLDVVVNQYRSQRVYISGDIAEPCTVPITDIQMNIIDALNNCKSLASKSGGGVGVQNVRLIRNGKSTLINLDKLYATGKEITLEPNDRLLIDDTANRVFMVGEFDSQKALPYSTGGLTLSDAIANAGGVKLGTADTSHIYVIRGFVAGKDFENGGIKTTMRPRIYVLNASDPSGLLLANQFELQPRDVVFASPASFVNFNRALSLVIPSLDLLTRGLYFYDRIGHH